MNRKENEYEGATQLHFSPMAELTDTPEGEKEGSEGERSTIEISAALPRDWIVGLQDMR